MSSMPRETFFRRKRNLAGSSWPGHCQLEGPAGQGGRLLAFVWASGGSAGQPPQDLDERTPKSAQVASSKKADNNHSKETPDWKAFRSSKDLITMGFNLV